MKIIYNIKVFVRIILQYKRHYLINIGALAISIAAFTIITSYIFSQKDYDSFHTNKDRIFRVINVRHYPTKVDKSAGCIEVVGPEMKSTFPEVEEFAHCIRRGQVVKINDQEFKERNIYYATPSFLKIFSFPIVKGRKPDNLTAPFTCLISEKMAEKYFGMEDPIGKQLDFVYEKPVTVEGVIKTPPSNSYFTIDILVSYSTVHRLGYCESCNNKNTFLLLKEGVDRSELIAKFSEFIKRVHFYDNLKREYLLQPLKEMYTTTDYRFEIGKTSNGEIFIYLGVIALLIITVSWLNYISVNSIISLKRLKEYGMKSVSGAKSQTIFWQIVTESLVTTLVATLLGVFIAWLALPYFYNLFAIEYFIIHPKVIFTLMVIAVVGAFVIAVFPYSIYLKRKSVNLHSLLKYQKSRSEKNRKLFIVFQNIISIILIAFSISTFIQFKFMVNYELGFNSDNLLVVNNNISNSEVKNPSRVFLESLFKYPEIEKVGYSSYLPGSENGDVGGGFRMQGQREEESIQLYDEAVSANFFELMDIPLVEGEGLAVTNEGETIFSDGMNGSRIVLNEAAVKQLGFDDNKSIIGKTIIRENAVMGTVVGVVKNYHQKSLDNPILPTFFHNCNNAYYFFVKMRPGTTVKTLDIINREYKKITPSGLFEYYFLKDQFQKQYVSYTSFLQVIFLFTILSLLISCTGMYSLSSYIILMRTKEIGIRKVNGAKTSKIMTMLNVVFAKWVAIAFVVACPIAWFAMHRWLENFAYRTNLSWWIFALAGLIALGIALLTVSFQSWRAATRNPVKSLRYE